LLGHKNTIHDHRLIDGLEHDYIRESIDLPLPDRLIVKPVRIGIAY